MPPGDVPAPTATLKSVYDAGCDRWPGVALTSVGFEDGVTACGAEPADLADRGVELFLTVACARGDSAALVHFDRDYLSAVPRHVARLRMSASQVDEIQQILRIRFLSGPSPRIAVYDARAPLDAWVRVAAVRVGLDLREAENRQPRNSDEDDLAALILCDADPELLAARGNVRESFQRALDESLAALGPKEKALLRMHFVEGLNIDAIGKVLRVHRATVARWLVTIRRDVFEGVRRRLALAKTPSPSDFRSLVRLVKGDLKVSMDRIFRP